MEQVRAIKLGRAEMLPGQETIAEKAVNATLDCFHELKTFVMRLLALAGLIGGIAIWMHYEIVAYPIQEDLAPMMPTHHAKK